MDTLLKLVAWWPAVLALAWIWLVLSDWNYTDTRGRSSSTRQGDDLHQTGD